MEQMTIQEALNYCLENPEGLSAEELLSKFPEYQEELASLLGLVASVGTLAAPSVPADRRAAMKARLMAAAAARAPRVVEAVPVVPVAPRPIDSPPPAGRPARAALPWFLSPAWIVASAAIVLVALSWWLSAGSLPDSPFYNVKLAAENIMLNLSGSDADKVQAHANLADSRLYDLRAMQKKGELAQAQPAFDNYQSYLENLTTLW